MVGIAAGMSTMGHHPLLLLRSRCLRPAAPIEQVRNSIGLSPPECEDRRAPTPASRVGEDGATHQCIEDIALMRAIPGMTVIVPRPTPTKQRPPPCAACELDGPVYMRLRRAWPCRWSTIAPTTSLSRSGKAYVLREGNDVTIVA